MSSHIVHSLIWIIVKAALVAASLLVILSVMGFGSPGVAAGLGFFIGMTISGLITQLAIPALSSRRGAKV